MYQQLKDECARIRFQCWLQRMAAARFMDNLEAYEDGIISREELTCFMPKESVNGPLKVTTLSTVVLVSVVEKDNKLSSNSTMFMNGSKAA